MIRRNTIWSFGFAACFGIAVTLGFVVSPMQLGAAALTPEDFVYLPKEFDVADFKFRQDQEVQIRAILNQDAKNRGELWDETVPAHVALNQALTRGPGPLISLLGSKDEYLHEVALDGLAIRFAANASGSIPMIWKLMDRPETDSRTRQLAVRALQRIAPRNSAVITELFARAQKVSPTDYPLRCAMVDFFADYESQAAIAVPWLEGELRSASVRVQYQAMQALSRIRPAPSVDPSELLAPGKLDVLRPEAWVQVENHLGKKGGPSPELHREVVRVALGETHGFAKIIALKHLNEDLLKQESSQNLVIQAVADEDEFVQGHAVDAILGLNRPPTVLVRGLIGLLEGGSSSLRVRVATILKNYGPEAAEAAEPLASLLAAGTERMPETELVSYLLALRSIGSSARPVADKIADLLEERAPIMKNRSKLRIHHLRGFIMLTLAEIGVPKKAIPYIIDNLANSPRNMPYPFACAARAAGSLDPQQGKVCVPFLLRALKNEVDDDYISFESLNVHRSSDGYYTTARLEAVRALGRIGSHARDAVPLIEGLIHKGEVNLSVSGRLHRIPSLVEEARKALKAIQS